MKDDLEDFVRRNRNSFDDRKPPARVWRAVERALTFSGTNRPTALFLWRAAAIFFMALSVYLWVPRQSAPAVNTQAYREFTDVEAFYTQQISHKVELIGEFSEGDGLNGFTHDFQQLEAMYLVLREEMKNRPSDKVKDALVLNLLVRIDLLNQQLHRLEQRHSREETAPAKKRV